MRPSLKAGPIICRPIGKFPLKPQGTERAGKPVKLLGPVKRIILSIKSTFDRLTLQNHPQLY